MSSRSIATAFIPLLAALLAGCSGDDDTGGPNLDLGANGGMTFGGATNFGGNPAGGAVYGAGGTVYGAGGAVHGVGGALPGAGGAIDPGAGGAIDPGAGGAIDPGAGGAIDPGAGGADPGAGGSGTGGSVDGAIIRGDAPTSDSATRAGPYTVQTYTNGFRDGPEYAGATIHYPVGAEPPYAIVAVVPGYVSPESSIKPWGPFLASHGIVTMTIGTNSPTDQPPARADALLDALETLRTENERQGGPIAGKLALDRRAVMGWSMGGGGTVIAASRTPALKAAIGLCAWSSTKSFPQNQVPTLLFGGSADNTAPVSSHSGQFYSSFPDPTPKMLFVVQGGSHSVANNPASGQGQVGRYGLSWMKVFLEGDERYRQFLTQQPSAASRFESEL